ncbi:MAG: transporter permease [Rhodospirillales bacterium]|nr:transporter permease [Rhodospirillales bacterium]
MLIGLVLGSFYALIAAGYTVIYGTVRLINFAHGDVYMIGAFVGALGFGFLSPLGVGPALVMSVLGTLLATAIVGFLIRLLLARLDSAPGSFSPIIAAVGISLVLENGAFHLWGSAPAAFPLVMPADGRKIALTLAAGIAVLLATDYWIARTKFGIAMRAVGSDHGATRLMGIRVEYVLYVTFAVFSAIAGLTGYLAGSYYGSIQFSMGFALGLKGFTAAVLGGMGNVRGALVGGLVLGFVEAFGGGWLGTEWTDVIAFSFLIAVLTLRPSGLLGETVVQRM